MSTYRFEDSIQRGIIYLCKSDKDFFLQVLPLMKPSYFDALSHQNIFQSITDHYEKYKQLPNDDFIIEECKKKVKKIEHISEYKTELESVNSVDVSSLNNRDYLLEKVEDFAQHQAVAGALVESVDLLKDGKVDIIPTMLREAMNVGRSIDIGQSYFDDIDARYDRLTDDSHRVTFKTPFPYMNEKVLEGGISKKELAMVVAPPGVGKSLYLVNQAAVAMAEGRNVLYISLEMSEDRVSQRLDSIITKVPQSRIRTDREEVKRRLGVVRKKYPNFGKLVIKEFPTKRCTVNALRAYLNQLKNFSEFEPDILIVDYLEIMSTDSSVPEYKSQEMLAQELRGLAVENDLAVWTATQTNRQGKSVDIIKDTELADSYGKIRTCDFVISLNQNAEERDGGEGRVHVMKNRNGRPGDTFRIEFQYDVLVMKQAPPSNQ